jgi:DNA repair exonuclease SbcCD ATPase subunit
MNVTSENTDPSHGDKNGTPPAHGANSGSHGDQSSTDNLSAEELRRLLADKEAEHAKVLADNQKYRKERQDQKAAEQAREAQEQAKKEAQLREQNQYKELAEKYGAEVQQLKPVQEDYIALSTVLADQLKEQVKDWPKEVKDLLPSDDTPIKDRYAQVQKLQAFVDKLQATPQTKPGHGPNPVKPAGEPTPEQAVEQKMKQLRATRKYF